MGQGCHCGGCILPNTPGGRRFALSPLALQRCRWWRGLFQSTFGGMKEEGGRSALLCITGLLEMGFL